jgi:hypothetical protein
MAPVIEAVLQRVVAGLLAGVGFALAIAGTVFAIVSWEKLGGREFVGYSARSGLVIEEHRAQVPANGAPFFVGTLRNAGERSWSQVALEVELFDRSNRFIDRCSGAEYATIAPGAARNFKVACDGIGDIVRRDYDHYAITITNATALPDGAPE